jgi:1-phosphatidylinositol-3-phosphate 5-kinase
LVQDKASSRIQATAIGQALVDAGFLECLSLTDQTFIDGYSLYRPKNSDITSSMNDSLLSSTHTEVAEVVEPEDTQEPLWVRQIGMQEDRQYHIQVNEGEQQTQQRSFAASHLPAPDTDMIDGLGRKNQFLVLPQKKNEELSLSTDLNSPNPAVLSSPTVPQTEAFTLPLPPITQESRLFFEHVQRLMKQLLSWQGLSFSWADILMPLVQSLAHTVRPDVRDDDDEMDIRQYIHIKKIPGGLKSDSKIVHGVVCSKNVANRSMPRWSHDPNILLLSSAIDYQRVENKLISLEPLMMQVRQ